MRTADLLCPLHHGIGQHSIDADRRKQTRNNAEYAHADPGIVGTAIEFGWDWGAHLPDRRLVTILVQPLPFPEADRLVRVVENVPSRVTGEPPVQRGVPYSDLFEWQSRSRTLTDTFAVAVNYGRIVKSSEGPGDYALLPANPL